MSTSTVGTEKTRDRYPGLKPFIVDDKAIFFGRDTETESIIQSISVNKAFIVWGKSGLGKSSLINAAVIPKLAQQNYIPLKIRFYNCKEDPIGIIKTEIINNIPGKDNINIPEVADDLGQLIRMLPKEKKPVLIFDQFEEFFYYPTEVRERAIAALAELVNVNRHFESTIGWLKETDISDKQDQPLAKLLFLIRSDRLNMMDEVALKIPGIFNNRYQLKPLLREKAEQSLELPAQISDLPSSEIRFKISPFGYSDEALRVILETLSAKNNEIESSQLQIVCQEFESIVENIFTRKNIRLLEPGDFNGETGIREILNGFYLKQIKKLRDDTDLGLSDDDVGKIKKLIENELLSGTKRIIQAEERVRERLDRVKHGIETIGNKGKVDAVLDKLLELRLIREEESHLGKVYEISHDTLLQSIIKSRDERIKTEKDLKIKKQAELLEKANLNSENERKLKDKARKDRIDAQRAEVKAVRAQKDAEVAWQLALQEEAKAKEAERVAIKARKVSRTFLNISTVSLIVVIAFAVFLINMLSNLRSQKDKYRKVYGNVLMFNSAKAYNDLNFSLAFNLAVYADSILDDHGKLLDSLLKRWSLAEYAGDAISVSKDESIVACHYKDNSLQILHFSDSTRKDNEIDLLDNVHYFKLGEDGRQLVTIDSFAKVITLYSLVKDNANKIYLRPQWQNNINYTGISKLKTILLNKQMAALLFEDSSLSVYSGKAPPVKIGVQAESITKYFWSNNKIYLESEVDSRDLLMEIDIKKGTIIPKKDYALVLNFQTAGYNFLISKKEGKIKKIEDDSFVDFIDVKALPKEFNVYQIIFDNEYFILSNGSRCIFVPKSDTIVKGRPFEAVRGKNFVSRDLGRFIDFSNSRSIFIKGDTLFFVKDFDNIHSLYLPFPANEFFNQSFYRQYSLSVNKLKIYYSNYMYQEIGCFRLSDTSIAPKIEYSRIHKIDILGHLLSIKMKHYDWFFLDEALTRIDSVTKDVNYWKSFYEPLNVKEKKTYSIEK